MNEAVWGSFLNDVETFLAQFFIPTIKVSLDGNMKILDVTANRPPFSRVDNKTLSVND